MYCEFGEKRNVDSGRSSPNCDPRLLNDCMSARGIVEMFELTFISWYSDFLTLTIFPKGNPASIR
jgi:hypothetical protein